MENFLNNFNFYFQATNVDELNAKKRYQALMPKIYSILTKKSSQPPKKY